MSASPLIVAPFCDFDVYVMPDKNGIYGMYHKIILHYDFSSIYYCASAVMNNY
jgi:hypothetical protein